MKITQKTINISKGLSVVLLAMAIFFGPQAQPAYAADCKTTSSVFLPRWYDGLCKANTDEIELVSGDSKDTGGQLGSFLFRLASNVVVIILYIVGYISLAFIIVGGFKYMTQGDSSSGTVAARKTIQNAVIGLILSIASVAIVRFVVDIF